MEARILEAAKFIHDEEHEHHKIRVATDGEVKDVWLLNRNGHNDAFYTKILSALGLNSYRVTPFDNAWFLASPAAGYDIRDIACPISETGRMHLAYYIGIYAAVADVFGKPDCRPKDFRIDAQALEDGRDGVTPIDHESLFYSREAPILQNVYWYTYYNRAPENHKAIPYSLSMLVFRNPAFTNPHARARLLERFEQGYLEGIKRARESLPAIQRILEESYPMDSAQRLGRDIAAFLAADPLRWLDEVYVHFLGAFFAYILNSSPVGVRFTAEEKQQVLSREVTWRNPVIVA
jgi:hypothetical protein